MFESLVWLYGIKSMDYTCRRSIVGSDGRLYGTTTPLCGSQNLLYRAHCSADCVLWCKLRGIGTT